MKCPSCSAAAEDAALECPSCGLVFAKWREREERTKREAAAVLARLEAPPAPTAGAEIALWKVRAAAVAFVLAWMAFLGLYYRRRMANITALPLGEPTGRFATVRDPRTGEMQSLPILRGPGVGVPAADAPKPAPAPTSEPVPVAPPPQSTGRPRLAPGAPEIKPPPSDQ